MVMLTMTLCFLIMRCFFHCLLSTIGYLDVANTIQGATGAAPFSSGDDGSLYIAVAFSMDNPLTNTQASILQMSTSIRAVTDPYVEEISSLQYEIGNLTVSSTSTYLPQVA